MFALETGSKQGYSGVDLLSGKGNIGVMLLYRVYEQVCSNAMEIWICTGVFNIGLRNIFIGVWQGYLSLHLFKTLFIIREIKVGV
jgi:hypothetical protein